MADPAVDGHADPPDPDKRAVDPHAEETASRYVNAVADVGAIKGAHVFAGPYRRLFAAQVVSSTGDWIGFLAIAALAKTLGKSNADVAVGAVLSARLIPGFFFGAFATGLIDRLDRKKVMVACDIGRGALYALIPFVSSVALLFVASLLLELLTLMWTPAKEASVPNLVQPDQLASANSASVAAAYGTILPAVLLYPALVYIANLAKLSNESLAFYVDVASFITSAFLISRLVLPRRAERTGAASAMTFRSTWRDAKEGWQFIGQTYRVRGVIIGFCTALIGGGMTVPLETTFSDQILHTGATGFALLAMSLGLGVAAGVLVISVTQKRIDHDVGFGVAVLGAGVALLFSASMAHIGLVMLGIGVLGLCAGTVYVLGFTILGESTEDDIRGRIFGVFYTLVRFCLLLAFTLAPLLSGLLDGLSEHFHRTVHGRVLAHQLGNSTFHVAIPGTRLTLLLGGLIILGAGWIARRDLRKAGTTQGS